MQLVLRRATRPGVFHRIIYVLDLHAELSEEERQVISVHGLAARRLYQRSELSERGRGVVGLLYLLGYRARNLTINARDLIDGRRVETADLAEVLTLEDLVTAAARTFHMLVCAAANFAGDEIVEL